ncbi:MAG: N-acetylmuramoyl-L-alanine amidase CwlD [Caldicoprobacterales bacterium]
MRVYFISKKWIYIFWIILGLIIGIVYLVKIREEKTLATFTTPAYGITVAIDAGHGGMDPGAVSKSGVREDEINLKIAKKLQAYLENGGAKVVMTRKTNEGLYDKDYKGSKKRQDMSRRVEILKKANPDIVISIHLNQFSQPQYFGAQTFYMKGSEEGKQLAEAIQQQLIRILNRGNKRQIKAADNFLILKAVKSPSVIVECGFLSNPQEETLLTTEDYQDQVAWAIYCGIISYLSK